jgi:uncharacterized membrane protein YphA (DoxX/SURF4 family)
MNALFKIVSPIAKYLFAIPFIIFGLFHFMSGAAMAEMVPIPGGIIWIYLTGVALIAAGVSVLIGKMTRTALLLLGVMLLLFVFILHIPAASGGDEAEVAAAMGNILKDVSLAGGAWILASRYDD